MTRNKNHIGSAKDVDRLFERGVSDVSRMPQVPMTDAQIGAVAATSKSGAGIWLLSHLKEIALCAVSFAVGAGATLLATHTLSDRNTSPQPAQSTVTVVSADTTMLSDDTTTLANETVALPNTPVEMQRIASLPRTTSRNASPKTFHGTSLQTEAKPTSPAATPVVITKTVTRHDTVHIHETITIKDTVYVP